MGLHLFSITFDAADPHALARFWTDVTGYSATFADENIAIIGGDGSVGPRMMFIKVPEGKAAKNRVHLDVRAAPGLQGDERMAALEVECDRLVALGATRVRRYEPAPPMSAGFIVLTDPEGNEFCLD